MPEYYTNELMSSLLRGDLLCSCHRRCHPLRLERLRKQVLITYDLFKPCQSPLARVKRSASSKSCHSDGVKIHDI